MSHGSDILEPNGCARSFLRTELGGALVEFALALPLMLVFFAAIVEGTRIMWSYQTAIEGVRDAARYFARVVPGNVCSLNGGDVTSWTTNSFVSGWQAELTQLVTTSLSGQPVFAPDVTLASPVTPSYICDNGTFRNSPVAIGRVTAEIKINLPFAPLLAFLGGSSIAVIDATLSNQARIYGS